MTANIINYLEFDVLVKVCQRCGTPNHLRQTYCRYCNYPANPEEAD